MFSWFKKKEKELEVKERPDFNIGQSEIIYTDPTIVPLGDIIKDEIICSKNEDWKDVSEPILSFVDTVKIHPEMFSYEINSVPSTNECLIKIIDKYNDKRYSLYVKGCDTGNYYVPTISYCRGYFKDLNYCLYHYSSHEILNYWEFYKGLRISTDVNINLTRKESMYLLTSLFQSHIKRNRIEKKKAILDQKKEQWKLRKELTKLYKG